MCGAGMEFSNFHAACDVASRIRAEFDYESPIKEIESAILIKLLESAYAKMDETEREELLRTLGVKYGRLPAALPIAAVQAIIQLQGFAAYQAAVIVANAVARAIFGRGLALAANAGLARGMGMLAGPIG